MVCINLGLMGIPAPLEVEHRGVVGMEEGGYKLQKTSTGKPPREDVTFPFIQPRAW